MNVRLATLVWRNEIISQTIIQYFARIKKAKQSQNIEKI